MNKYIIKTITYMTVLFGCFACHDDLLNQPTREHLSSSIFWETTNDAEYALNGAVADIRYLFDRDYYLDAMGEFVYVRGCTMQGAASNSDPSTALRNGGAYDGFYELNPSGYGNSFSNMYKYCYGGINRCNYVIEGIQNMINRETSQDNIKTLESFVGEAKLYRALIYLRLISLWGDVPYIDERIYYREEADTLSRRPIRYIKDRMLEDLNYAYEKLPDTPSKYGRLAKPAALALRGKVNLYWASWNKFGWPELDTFTPNDQEAQDAYTAAASDFRKVIDEYGLQLFRNGEPGTCDPLGEAENLPNYYYLFTNVANGNSEFIIAFTHGGVGTDQGESLMRDLAGRTLEYGQCWVTPRFEVADRYQDLTTGDFRDPLVPMSPTVADARVTENSAINPASYDNRDYRLKSTLLWDYEMIMGIYDKAETGFSPFIYKTWGVDNFEINGKLYKTYETDGCMTGYVFRKFVRNYPGQGRNEGDVDWPVIRLADVYLMYAEAVNFANLAAEKDYAIQLVNRVRHRGNLPALSAEKTATQEAFFEAIEQERIVELIGEGQRPFDLRRWRKIEERFAPPGDPDGYVIRDTWGNPTSGFSHSGTFFQNATNQVYERCYIFAIPQSERNRNPNLTQNKPWL